MAVQEQRASNTLEKYIAEVRAVWGDGKDPQLPFKVAALMEKLFASTSPDDPWMAELIRGGKPSRELYRDPDHSFIQMGHIHKQRHGNEAHPTVKDDTWLARKSFSNRSAPVVAFRISSAANRSTCVLLSIPKSTKPTITSS